jgi:integrase
VDGLKDLGASLSKSDEVLARDRIEAEKSPATINRETQLLGQALRLAHQRGKIGAVPHVRQLPERNTRQGFFERGDFEAVVAALPDHLKDIARFGYQTGWRKGEIISLTWPDVDRDGGVIRLRPEASKNGQPRLVPFDRELAALIDRRWQARLLEDGAEVRVTDLVFHREGEPIVDFRKAWTSACVAAGLYHVVKQEDGSEQRVPEKLFHDLRRTAARNMVRAGVPERVAMEITGHRTRSMFDRYNIVSEDDLRSAMQKTAHYVDTLPRTRTPGE